MTYTFRTRCELIKHLRALTELSCGIEHSALPMKDFEIELPYLLTECLVIKRLSQKSSLKGSYNLYIAFRTQGFEFFTSAHAFSTRLSCFTNVIACYTISFVDGYYTLQQFTL